MGINRDNQYKFNLFYRTYIDWTVHCQNSEEARMTRITEENNIIANVQLFYIIISFLSLLIIGVISPGFIGKLAGFTFCSV
jgi:fatty-acid desaturase